MLSAFVWAIAQQLVSLRYDYNVSGTRVLALHTPSLADIIIILFRHVFYNPASGSGGAMGVARGCWHPSTRHPAQQKLICTSTKVAHLLQFH